MIEISIKTSSGEELNIKIDGKEISSCGTKEASPEFVTQVLSFNDAEHLWEEQAKGKDKEVFVPPPPLARNKKPVAAKSVMAPKKKKLKKGRK